VSFVEYAVLNLIRKTYAKTVSLRERIISKSRA
jgi:hypothetical protein